MGVDRRLGTRSGRGWFVAFGALEVVVSLAVEADELDGLSAALALRLSGVALLHERADRLADILGLSGDTPLDAGPRHGLVLRREVLADALHEVGRPELVPGAAVVGRERVGDRLVGAGELENAERRPGQESRPVFVCC
jgi:hypothetical protein